MSTVTFTLEEIEILSTALRCYENGLTESVTLAQAIHRNFPAMSYLPATVQRRQRVTIELRAKLYVLQDAGGCASLFDKVVVTNDTA